MNKDKSQKENNFCSCCNQYNRGDLRILADSPYWAICSKCRSEQDVWKSQFEDEHGNIDNTKVVTGTNDRCSCGSQEELVVSGYGGYRKPEFSFTCRACIDESQARYEEQLMEVDYHRGYDY